MTIIIPASSIEMALAKFAKWEHRRVELDFPEGTVRIVATGDPDLPWIVEVLEELMIKDEDELC